MVCVLIEGASVVKSLAFVAGLGLIAAAVPASASTVIEGSCASVASAAGCLFEGNINSNANGQASSYLSAQTAYNLFNDTHPSANPDINLSVIGSTDDANFASFGSFTGAGTASGTWTLKGYVADFVAVKAGNYFTLYQLATPASSGSWDTFDIPYNNNPRDLSHLMFFGQTSSSAVPEPTTWAMFIGGFGLIGSAMRRRQKVAVTFA
jgi:hypothetical protein